MSHNFLFGYIKKLHHYLLSVNFLSPTSSMLLSHGAVSRSTERAQGNPLDLENIKEKQDEDNDLQQSLNKHPDWYSCKNINDVNDILCYTKPGDNAANWKIVLPKDFIVPTIRWYHQVIQGAKDSINTYINNIIIVMYADLSTTSSAIIAKEIN